MGVVFENKDVADKYEACRTVDGKVHVPSGKVHGSGYMGPLSKITLGAADKMFASGSNNLKLKTAAPKEVKASKNGNTLETVT